MKGFAATLALLAALAVGAPAAKAGVLPAAAPAKPAPALSGRLRRAYADCGVPDGNVWIDYAGHDAPVPAEPGVVLAVSSGTDVPAQMRAKGAATVFFDLHFNDRVGTPTKPADPATIPARAQRLFDFAVQVTGCTTPVIAENELFGAQTPTPWTPGNAQYRANTLALLQDLAALGARPAITIANPPFTGGDAADWWREVAKVAILVRQVYFTSPNANGLYKLGPEAAGRTMRNGLRHLVTHLTQIGIPAGRIALELQFQSAPGLGARAGLQPKEAWLEIVKLEALAAKQVLREYRIQGIWSWGFATFSAEGQDPDKPAAACVWLWARDPRLCDGPGAGGPRFDASLTEGRLQLPAGVRCRLDAGDIRQNDIGRLTALTGDADLAASVLLEHLVLQQAAPVDPVSVLSAERAVVGSSFGGSRGRYLSTLRAQGLSLADARALVADRIARDRVEARFEPRAPSATEVADFRATYASQPARLVQATPAAPWLGGAERGWVVSSLAPDRLFRLRRSARVDTPDGVFRVTPLGPAVPLGLLPPTQAVAAARAALQGLRRGNVYGSWLKTQETRELRSAVCLRDDLPATGPTDLGSLAPFLLG